MSTASTPPIRRRSPQPLRRTPTREQAALEAGRWLRATGRLIVPVPIRRRHPAGDGGAVMPS